MAVTQRCRHGQYSLLTLEPTIRKSRKGESPDLSTFGDVLEQQIDIMENWVILSRHYEPKSLRNVFSSL